MNSRDVLKDLKAAIKEARLNSMGVLDRWFHSMEPDPLAELEKINDDLERKIEEAKKDGANLPR